MRKKAHPRRILLLMLCLALSVGLMVIPASASVDDDLESYGQALARENGAAVGGRLSEGGGSNEFQYNSTSASSGRGLYVLDVYTTVSYEQLSGNSSNCHMDFSLFYLGSDRKVYWTDDFEFNGASQDFMHNTAALKANQVDGVSLQLPANCWKVLAVYFHKDGGPIQGKNEWAASYLRVAKVSGTIGDVGDDGMGFKYRSFSGTYMGGVANLNELNYNGWGNYLWRLNQPVDTANNSCAKSYFALELVAGEDGYVNKNGTVTINYTDSIGLTYNREFRLREGYAAFQSDGDIKDAEKDVHCDFTATPWLETSVREMQGLANGHVGNYYTYQNVSETLLRPYTSFSIPLVMPQNITRINSISLSLDAEDNLILQSARLIELDYLSGTNYWNGSFGLERLRAWSGRVMAQSAAGPYTINGKSSITFVAGQAQEFRRLETYARGQGPYVDNKGTGVGVSVQIADVLGAGIESMLAWNSKGHGGGGYNGSLMTVTRAGEDAYQAWYNLNIFRQECMTLSIRYKDTLGATRQVDVPFMTTYLLYLLKENQGKLTGGSWETWVSGIFQQNENIALPIKLAEYGSLESVSLTYGSAPYGFTSGNKGTVDTTSDTINVENICFYEGVTGSNFNSKYDSKKLACMLNTSLTPTYSYSAASQQGQQLARGGVLSASVADGKLAPGPAAARDYSNKYLVRIKTADIETAGTDDPISIALEYTDSNGDRKTTSTYSIPTLAANHYGYTYRRDMSYDIFPPEHQYERHMRRNCVCEFVVELPNAQTINSATLTIDGTNEWQMEYINIYSLTSLEQRYGERSYDEDAGVQLYWRRDYTGEKVATARQSVLLYGNNPSRTINFTTYTEEGTPIEPEQGTKTEDFLTSLPDSMTYNDTKKNLGLSIIKYTYQVDVEVADVEDAGSANYFYFQLVFENGTSGVVLANQQLASDSFRQGNIESFLIKATQNYGNVVSVRIICDNTSSQSNVFDKLNIDNITITMKSSNGISKSWIVEKVGWIDITVTDEGANAGVDGLEELTDTSSSNVEVVKEFAVTRQATAVDLLFCISTSASSASDSANPMENALKGKFEATLIYRDSSGMEKSQNFDLTAKIQEYNDTDKTFWLYRPNHVDRFTMSMPDVTSVIALLITRTGGEATWVVDSVSIQQIGGLGEVYLSPTMTEYIRDSSNASDLAVSTNSNGINYSISGSGNATITFTENSIEVGTREEQDSWNAAISRVPVLNSESLNIYLLPGSVIGNNYSFTTSSPAVRATVKYTTVYGGSLVQNSFTLGNLGELNGQTVLYGKNLEVSAMSSLSSLVLSSTAASGSQPYIGSAIVERSRGGVLMGTYYFNFGNYYLGNGNPEFSPTTTVTSTAMHQTLRLQPAYGQSVSLTPEARDIAVALRYTSTLDPAENKTVYQSPYVYFTDAGYTSVTTGKFVDIPFSLSNVDEILGLSIATTGPMASFDNAIIYNYSGTASPPAGVSAEEGSTPGTEGGETAPALMGICGLSQTITATTLPTAYTANGQMVTPAVFHFTTAPEAANAGAGTSGMVSMTVYYTDSTGGQDSMSFNDLLSYLPSSSTPVPGSVIDVSLQLSDAAYLNSITLSAEDSWLLSSVSAELSLPDGTTSVSSTSVNNWAKSTAPLTIDMLSPLHGGEGEGNQIQTFTVTGRARNAQIAASASATVNSGGSLLVTAYEGDTVDLTPVVSAIGEPDVTWSWNTAGVEGSLSIQDSGSATFQVPSSMAPGDSCTFSVACNGDKRLAVSITIAVEAEPEPEPEIDPGLIDFGYEDEIGTESTD